MYRRNSCRKGLNRRDGKAKEKRTSTKITQNTKNSVPQKYLPFSKNVEHLEFRNAVERRKTKRETCVREKTQTKNKTMLIPIFFRLPLVSTFISVSADIAKKGCETIII